VPVSTHAQVLPLDDGRVLLCQPVESGRHEIWLSDHPGLRLLASPPALGLRLIEHPSPTHLALVVSTTDAPSSTLWRLDETGLHPVLTLPGLLAGGSWLDPVRGLLGLNQALGGTIRALVVDVSRASADVLWPEHPTQRLLLAVPQSGLAVVADGPERVGWIRDGEPPRWPAAMAATLVLAADPAGRRLLLRTEDGARSGLVEFSPDNDTATALSLPDGAVGGPASWTRDGVRVPFARPGHPLGIAEIRPDGAFHLPADSAPVDGPRSRLHRFAGSIEAVVYGDWSTAPAVLVALHGGPDAAWRLDSDVLLERLAEAGLAVVAVNPRGGRGSSQLLHGAWGGPDLADVAAVVNEIGRPVRLLGTSYGAFLALLALGLHPMLWERAAVVAPFLSGPRLYADAGPRVRALLDRLGGREVYVDERGPRDVTALADRIRTPLLCIHGDSDEVIPVAHSRELSRLLPTADYLEVAGAGHDPFTGPNSPALRRLVEFLTAAPTDLAPESRGEPYEFAGRR